MLSETWWGTRVWDRRWGFPMRDPVEPFRTRLLDSFISLLDRSEAADFPLDFNRYRALVLSGPPQLQRYLSVLGDVWKEGEGKVRWGEKTPVHIWYLPVLHMMFPQMRAIHLVRDPRATVASLIKAPFTKLTDPLALAWDWRHSVERALELESQVPMTTFRYEDLVSRPEKTVEAICAAIDLPFDPGMLDYKRRSDRYIPRQPWMHGLGGPLSTSRINRWENAMGVDDLLYVEAMTAELMQRLQYETKAPKRALRKVAPVIAKAHAAQARLAEERSRQITDLVSMQRGAYRDLLATFGPEGSQFPS